MICKKIVLLFPHKLVGQPIVCKLVKDYDLEFNILKANVTPKEEGVLVMELSGKDKNYEQGIQYLKKTGVKVQPLSKDITRDEKKCTHCSVCVPICTAGALIIEPLTRKVRFDNAKCIACELCVPACPVQAMEVHF